MVTEATRASISVTELRRDGKAGSTPWLSTAAHRYVIALETGGCRVTFTQDLTRLDGAPWMLRAPGLSRLVFWMSARYMRRGFDGLLALPAQRAGTKT